MAALGNFTIDSVSTADGRHAARAFGGDCVYSAVGAHIWGAAVRVVSVVGDDYPAEWLGLLESSGIRTELVRHVSIPHGLVAPMNYDEAGRRENERAGARRDAMAPAEGLSLWRTFSPTAEDAEPCLGQVDCMHLAPMPVARQNELLTIAAGTVRVLTLDIPWFPGRTARGELPEVGLASAVLLSDAEIKGHYGEVPVGEAAADLMRRGARIVAVKQGGRGSIVFYPEEPHGVRLPVVSTQVLDPTGAGDAYCGGFAVGLWQIGNPIAAGLYGTVAASFVIEGFGANHALQYGYADAHRRLGLIRPQFEASHPNLSLGQM